MMSASPEQSTPSKIWLAPMEGVVDWVLRDLLSALGGLDHCVTEFIRVTDRLLPDHEFSRYCPELATGGHTRAGLPVIVQLLGGQPGPVAENAALAISLGAPAIDLNFGCPAKTVNRHDGGAALLKNPERVFDVTSAVRRAVPAANTVSAKVRLGFSDKSLFLDIAHAAEAAGAAWLTVHARTRDEGYRPPAHWEYIARIREAVKIPVIANGEIWTVEDYHRCREVTGCKDVMIGRGLLADPGLAFAIKNGFEKFDWTGMVVWLESFVHASREFRHEHYAVTRCKQMLRYMSRNNADALALFEEIKRLEKLDEVLTRLRLAQAAVEQSSAQRPATENGKVSLSATDSVASTGRPLRDDRLTLNTSDEIAAPPGSIVNSGAPPEMIEKNLEVSNVSKKQSLFMDAANA